MQDSFFARILLLFSAVLVKGRITAVKIPGIEMILDISKPFSKSLKMHDLAFTQEPDRVADLGILDKTQDIVVCCAGFLLCCNCERTTYYVEQTGQAAFQIKDSYFFAELIF